ncbi:MAG: hypothetical protein R2932_07225 [Caldilineaceae bacterium]
MFNRQNRLQTLFLLLTFALSIGPKQLGAAELQPTTRSADQEPYTYTLSQSTSTLQVWTAPPSHRVFQDETPPTVIDNEVPVYAAANEFEPLQIIIQPTQATQVQVTIGNFGSGITAELYQVAYVNVTQTSDSLGRAGPYPDPLWPLANGATVNLAANQNTAFWINVSVPKGTAAGDYPMQVQIGDIMIPVRLHVFNFAMPDELHVKSQMNFSHQAILSSMACKARVLITGFTSTRLSNISSTTA